MVLPICKCPVVRGEASHSGTRNLLSSTEHVLYFQQLTYVLNGVKVSKNWNVIERLQERKCMAGVRRLHESALLLRWLRLCLIKL